jgi:hypothetical protein
MWKKAIKNIGLLAVSDCGCPEGTYYGCNQEWYDSRWRRVSGCGPSVVANIVSYMERASTGACVTKREFVALMDEIWGHVTPTARGLPTTKALRRGLDGYIEYKGWGFTSREMSIPAKVRERPPLSEVISFLGEALDNDMPVAFLALDNGDESRLDDWHWVTLVSLVHDEMGAVASVGIIDSGRLFGIDLYKWYRTTSRGGGFVSIRRE